MTAYLLLIVITVLLVFFTVRIVRRTGQWSFAVGMAVLYAWTFLGAWLFIGDALSGYQGYRIGFNYYYLMEKMFPFEVDRCYTIALLGYAAFTFLLLAGVWLVVRRSPRPADDGRRALVVDHRVFLLLAAVGAIASYAIIRPVILEAIAVEKSIYQYTRHAEYAGATIHALCNELVCLSLLMGWAIHLTSPGGRYFKGLGQRWAGRAYPAGILAFAFYLMVLGNRHELFMALLLGGAIFLGNAARLERRKLVLYLGVCLVPMFVTGKVRNLTWQEMSELDLEGNQQDAPFTLPLIQHVPRHPKGAVTELGEKLFSNELFCAHFSLYGICREHVRPAPFISARYLAASLVPRVVKADRPPTAYDHYAEQARLTPGQGYTIHHAAGWYINGGWAGLALGGLLLGLFWGALMRLRALPPAGPMVLRVFAIMGTGCWVAFLPLLVRDGPEIFKGLVFEGFAMPMGIVVLAVLLGRARERKAAAA
ncbi:MAG: hypothetical protein JST66_12640 [Bacteroidetes bacterium]|nr:hypothetical protein [Bacteroidota bacterium]